MKTTWLYKIKGVQIIEPSVHMDHRGDLWTFYKQDEFLIKDLVFNHDKFSTSRKNVLRGIHGDFKSWKLITCVYGELYFVVVDNRKESKTYRKWNSMILDDKKRKIVLLPPGVGNGFLVLSDDSVFSYKWSYPGKYPDVEDQFTIKWNDPTLNIDWPITNPILHERDK
ncbi:MAG: dTDP-4-dehydrorhamnose 3,5-epimerase family protein [Promethearchaeota archaeon]|jgi:dTDP-4-dehydrorhamnose 3,5-epimerase